MRWMVCGLLLLTGCGAPPDPLVPVRGRITLDGQPLPRGSVSLRPESGTSSWEQPTGMIDANGNYAVYLNGRVGVPPGKYRVVVFATEAAAGDDGKPHPGLPRSLIPTHYNDPAQTTLRLEVPAPSGTKTFDLELSSHELKNSATRTPKK